MSAEVLMDTPMLKQYKAIKANYLDAVLFFRLGDFYEMFLDDAKIASKELELTLTGRGKNENRIPMCGIPYHAATSYISKLINRGYKVAICEQVEDPALAKGLTKREVIKIITPGTVIEHSALEEKENNYLAAIMPKAKEDGFCGSYVDITTGEFMVFSLKNFTELQAQLDSLAAKEVLIPYETKLNLNQKILTNYFNPLDQKLAEEKLLRHFDIHSLTSFGIEEERGTYPTAWAIIDYLKTTQKHNLPQITKITLLQKEKHLFLDNVTRKNLELTESLYKNEKTGTLFWVLDENKTAMGARKLKQLLKNPFYDEIIINQRLDAIEVLKNDLLSREEIREILQKTYDLERLSARIVSQENNPRDCEALKDSIKNLQELSSILAHLKSEILGKYGNFFAQFNLEQSPYNKVINLIERALIDNPPSFTKEANYIREGYSEDLDELKLSFKSIKTWINSLEEIERKNTGIKTLKVSYNRIFGYYIEVTNTQSANVPAHYIRKQTLTNAERYITPELKEKENVLLHAEEKQLTLELKLFKELINELKLYIPELQELAKILADLDTLQALATLAQKQNYVRPEFVQNSKLLIDIKESRHPVLEKITNLNFIPNDIYLSSDKNRFILITGPNMAGKSTLMRQVALTVIMAQIGSFVPAREARISLVDKLFTRIGALDNLYFGHSTFMVEMLETATILNNATKHSLIILDEIGRGTSTFDGMSIACAVSEYIYNNIGARTLFATHYHELTTLEKMYPAFNNFSMKIAEDAGKIVFKYQFCLGPADKSYGVHVAQMAGLPKEVIKKATKILAGLEEEGLGYLGNKHSTRQLKLF